MVVDVGDLNKEIYTARQQKGLAWNREDELGYRVWSKVLGYLLKLRKKWFSRYRKKN